jgi:hypothetical protein
MPMNLPDLIARLERACSELCHRCSLGHVSSFDEAYGFWVHGTDEVEVGCGVYAPPEHCPAGTVRDVIEAAKAGEKVR